MIPMCDERAELHGWGPVPRQLRRESGARVRGREAAVRAPGGRRHCVVCRVSPSKSQKQSDTEN